MNDEHLTLGRIRPDIITNVHRSSVILRTILSNFNFLNRLPKNPHISNLIKSVKWDPRFPCGQTGKYDEPESLFSVLQTCLKTAGPLSSMTFGVYHL